MGGIVAVLSPLPLINAHGGVARVGSVGASVAVASSNFTLQIAGFVQGSGQATLSGNGLSINATVSQEGGASGIFTATNLVVDASSHFSGTGTVLGQSMTIGGRLDTPQAKETQLRTCRVMGTFVTTGGSYGRVAGYVPVVEAKP